MHTVSLRAAFAHEVCDSHRLPLQRVGNSAVLCYLRVIDKVRRMVDRLSRLNWVYQRAPVYFVTAVSYERRKILADARVYEGVLKFAEAGPALGFWLGAFVLMPDHFHGFVAVDHGQPSATGSRLEDHLSRWMKSFKNSISKILREARISAPHWQRGHFDHALRSDESFSEKWSYVRENPVRAGLVEKAEDWPYFGEPFPLDLC